eukprot:12420970-Karenia_brevis.AAC.1
MVTSHDMTGTTLSKLIKPALYPTVASDQLLEYFAAESQGLPKYDNLMGVQLQKVKALRSKPYWYQ